MFSTFLFLCAMLTIATTLPLSGYSPVEVAVITVDEPTSLTTSSLDGNIILVREKRQNFGRERFGGRPRGGAGRFPGSYPGGGFGGGNPGGGFGGGYPGGGIQTPSFSSSAANAQSQAFNAGNFGASSSGANTQGFNFGPNGFQGSAGQSFSQSYKFPGLDISVSGAETFGVGPGGVTRGGGSAVTVNGKPFTG